MLEIALCNLQNTLMETVSAVSILLTSLTFRGFILATTILLYQYFSYELLIVCSVWFMSSITLILGGPRADKRGRLCFLIFVCFLLPIFDIITLVCSVLKLRIRSYFNVILKLISFTFLITEYLILSGPEFTITLSIR